MKNVQMAFDPLDNGIQPPNEYHFLTCYMIFDLKMEDFHQKAQLVAFEHMTDVLATVTYASVVSREIIRIALTMAVLNVLT